MNQSIQALEEQYMWLRESLHELEARCETEDQKVRLRDAVARSRDSYNAAVRGVLHDDDEDVAALTSEMKTIQVELDKEVKDLCEVSKVLDMITKAVKIGSQVAAKAAVP